MKLDKIKEPFDIIRKKNNILLDGSNGKYLLQNFYERTMCSVK